MKRVIFTFLLTIFFLSFLPSCKKFRNQVGINLKIINSSAYPIYDIHVKDGLPQKLKTIKPNESFNFRLVIKKNTQVEIIYKNHQDKEKEIKTDYTTKILTSSPTDIVVEVKDNDSFEIKHLDNSFDGINKKLEETPISPETSNP
jgi:hypothetical protein